MPYEKKWTGDKGETSLRTGKRVSKDSLRVEAYGSIDELCSFIGLARAESTDTQISDFLEDVQNDLFSIGADLSTPNYEKVKRLGPEKSTELEESIKKIDSHLDDLKNFILPGGTRLAAELHVCRTICRRAERQIVALGHDEGVNEEVLKYMNRLSDVFLQLARLANKRGNVSEKIWKQ